MAAASRPSVAPADCRELPEKFHPSKSFKFCKRTFGKKNEERSFRAEWCEKYPWLHYDIANDAVLCILLSIFNASLFYIHC